MIPFLCIMLHNDRHAQFTIIITRPIIHFCLCIVTIFESVNDNLAMRIVGGKIKIFRGIKTFGRIRVVKGREVGGRRMDMYLCWILRQSQRKNLQVQ
jgi:hypothetical protein